MKPTYVNVTLRDSDTVLTGWLTSTDKPGEFKIQPSVEYDPDVTAIPFDLVNVAAVSPAVLPAVNAPCEEYDPAKSPFNKDL